MDTKVFARLCDGRVVEFLTTDVDPRHLFNPEIHWVEVTDHPEVQLGWEYDGACFTPPAAPETTDAEITIQDLQARLQDLGVQISSLLQRQLAS